MDEQTEGKLRFISATHRAAFEQRQRYEWQMLVMTLTFYVLTVAAVYAGDFRLPKSPCTTAATFLVALVLAYISCGFLSGVHEAHCKNKRVAEAAERAIVMACGKPEVAAALPQPRSPCENHWNWSLNWQRTVIIVFASVSVLLISYAPELPPKQSLQNQSTN
jgi:uncharacterized membrane protein (DUF485 family)